MFEQQENQDIIKIKGLELKFKTEENSKVVFQSILNKINFDIIQNETFVLLGESGSGKSLTALSIMDLLPKNAYFGAQSQIRFEGKNLLSLSEYQMKALRGQALAMIFQEPMMSLNPVRTIEEQMAETFKVHRKTDKTSKLSYREIKTKIRELLEAVHIKDPERVQNSYPHQLSGGMKQRIMIAMALAGEPKLLIADEPTTALDVTTAVQILKLLKEIQQKRNMAILFITHDMGVAKSIGKNVGIMKAGELVEQGNIHEVLKDPKHPYTQQLIEAKPKLEKLPFNANAPIVLEVKNLKIDFPIKEGLFKRTVKVVSAVDEVSFSVQQGETLALVGESGSGKTTVAKAVMGLIKPNQGEILWAGKSIENLTAGELRRSRSLVQIIFQDPFGAMDPRFRVVDILLEGMNALGVGRNKTERVERAVNVLEQVGLGSQHLYRFPHQFSGGQRQRICIARALAVDPKVIVCDEAISSLDVTLGAQILDLLIALQQQRQLSYLFITHNLAIIRTLAHKVAVMYQGKLVEYGMSEVVLDHPKHEYTKKLLADTLSLY